jgi:hypothetical protein
VKALAQNCPDQQGSGEFPATIVKIALSKHIISRTMQDAELPGSQKSKEESQFQQDASANEPLLAGRFVIGRSGRLEFRALRDWVRCERAGRPAFAFPIPSSMDEAQP